MANRTPPPKQSKQDVSIALHAVASFDFDFRMWDLKHSGSRLSKMGMIPVSTIVITLTITSSMAADSMPKCLECMEVLGGLYADTQQGLLYLVGCYAL